MPIPRCFLCTPNIIRIIESIEVFERLSYCRKSRIGNQSDALWNLGLNPGTERDLNLENYLMKP